MVSIPRHEATADGRGWGAQHLPAASCPNWSDHRTSCSSSRPEAVRLIAPSQTWTETMSGGLVECPRSSWTWSCCACSLSLWERAGGEGRLPRVPRPDSHSTRNCLLAALWPELPCGPRSKGADPHPSPLPEGEGTSTGSDYVQRLRGHSTSEGASPGFRLTLSGVGPTAGHDLAARRTDARRE